MAAQTRALIPPPLAILHGPQTIQTFIDRAESKATEKPQQRHGSLRHMIEELRLLNERGHGIYFTVNVTNEAWRNWRAGKVGSNYARKKSDIDTIRAYYCDIDGLDEGGKDAMGAQLLAHKLAPSSIVETKNGLHCYWYAQLDLGVMVGDEEIRTYERVVRGLNAYWGGDPNVKDVARVMRVPGFDHMKDPDNPFEIRVRYESHATYRAADLLKAFPAPAAKAPVAAVATRDENTGEDWAKVLDALASWPATAQGTRHKVLLLACGVGKKFGRSRSEVESDLAPIVTRWDTGRNMHSELANAVRWAFVSGELATVSALRSEGVDIPKLSNPSAD